MSWEEKPLSVLKRKLETKIEKADKILGYRHWDEGVLRLYKRESIYNPEAVIQLLRNLESGGQNFECEFVEC